jgi:tRNA A37 threonylcarbamoyladenosine dehydratase
MEELDAEEKAFQNKFSRQIATMGLAAVRKLVKMKVLIVGCGGVGAETAKNVILQGTRAVTLYDPVRRVACHHQVRQSDDAQDTFSKSADEDFPFRPEHYHACTWCMLSRLLSSCPGCPHSRRPWR